MRKDWEYKKFEECISKVPKTPKIQSSAYNQGSKYPIISQEENALISGFCDDESLLFHIERPVVIFGDHTRALKYIDFDFAIGADGVKVILPKAFLNAKFLLYYLKWYNIPNLGYSRHYKLLKEVFVPIPTTEKQLAIVAELDKINELIQLKKEQLKDYDQLAQSIFYEMFGDPVENEKGWEVKKLKEVCDLKAGKAIKANELSNDNPYPCYGGNGIRGYINRCSHVESSPIIGRQGAYCGTVNFAEAPFYATEHAVVVRGKQDMQIKWLYYTLVNLKLTRYAKGQAQPGIAVSSLNELVIIPLPPLPLQQQFAARIEAIERQKQQVSETIKDLETLLASRMQYWFD